MEVQIHPGNDKKIPKTLEFLNFSVDFFEKKRYYTNNLLLCNSFCTARDVRLTLTFAVFSPKASVLFLRKIQTLCDKREVQYNRQEEREEVFNGDSSLKTENYRKK